jgi:hypothetical protein
MMDSVEGKDWSPSYLRVMVEDNRPGHFFRRPHPRAPIDGLGNYTSGSVGKLRISPLGDMTRAWNDRKPRVLMGSPASSTGVAILATETIVVTTHPNEGPKSPSMTHEQ